MNLLSLPIDTVAAFLLGALLGVALCGWYRSRRHDQSLSDGEPGYTHRSAERL
jgi:hypothetical protein